MKTGFIDLIALKIILREENGERRAVLNIFTDEDVKRRTFETTRPGCVYQLANSPTNPAKKIESTYHRPIRQNKPIRQLRRITRKPHRKNTTPIMSDNNNSPLVGLPITINPIQPPNSNNKLSQFLQHIRRGIFIQAISSPVTRQIDRNDRRRVLKRTRADNMSPYRPAIWESVNKYNQWLGVWSGVGFIVADVVEFEAVAQGQELVGEAGPVV